MASHGRSSFTYTSHSLNCRSETRSIFQVGFLTNRHLLAAILASSLAQLAVIYLPFAQGIFNTLPIQGHGLLIVFLLALSPLVFGELRKAYHRRALHARARTA